MVRAYGRSAPDARWGGNRTVAEFAVGCRLAVGRGNRTVAEFAVVPLAVGRGNRTVAEFAVVPLAVGRGNRTVAGGVGAGGPRESVPVGCGPVGPWRSLRWCRWRWAAGIGPWRAVLLGRGNRTVAGIVLG